MVKLGYNVSDNEIREEEYEVNVYEVLYEVADVTGIGTTKMAEMAGKNQSYISANKNRGSIPQIDTVARLLGVCGWSLVALPNESIPEDALTIDTPSVTKEDKRLLNERKKAALLRQLDKLEAEGELLG